MSGRYWRNKQGAEIDFVGVGRTQPPLAIECQWAADQFDAAGMQAFRALYPTGANFVVAHDVLEPFTKRVGPLTVRFVSLTDLIRTLNSERFLARAGDT